MGRDRRRDRVVDRGRLELSGCRGAEHVHLDLRHREQAPFSRSVRGGWGSLATNPYLDSWRQIDGRRPKKPQTANEASRLALTRFSARLRLDHAPSTERE